MVWGGALVALELEISAALLCNRVESVGDSAVLGAELGEEEFDCDAMSFRCLDDVVAAQPIRRRHFLRLWRRLNTGRMGAFLMSIDCI